ncbi:MAG: hypothetical protein AAB654_07285 [Acidobacteriota bacterium]
MKKLKRVALALKLNPLRFECAIDDGGSGVLPLSTSQAKDLGATLICLASYLESQEQAAPLGAQPADKALVELSAARLN